MDLDPGVDTSAAEEWCAAEGMLFFTTKTGENLPEIFDSIAKQYKNAFEKRVSNFRVLFTILQVKDLKFYYLF